MGPEGGWRLVAGRQLRLSPLGGATGGDGRCRRLLSRVNCKGTHLSQDLFHPHASARPTAPFLQPPPFTTTHCYVSFFTYLHVSECGTENENVATPSAAKNV